MDHIKANELMMKVVRDERRKAIQKHGNLRPNLVKWISHLSEECVEAMVDLNSLLSGDEDARNRAVIELAQLTQLSMEIMVQLIMRRV